VLIMMMLTNLGTVPASFGFTFSFGVVELMGAALAVSALGIAAALWRANVRTLRAHDAGRFVSPVARQAVAA
jgi:hypothetical protein